MTVDELVKLISNPEGEIYPFSYSANMMGAHGVNPKLVEYFHKAAADANRASSDRNMILEAFRKVDEGAAKEAKHASFLRMNQHLTEPKVTVN